MKKNFKNGQWIIRRWAKENGGETDFVRFDKDLDNGKKFSFTKYYRILKKKVENISEMDNGLPKESDYQDYRMSLQFRPATKSEIQRYAEIIMNR